MFQRRDNLVVSETHIESQHRSTEKHEVSFWRVVITEIFRYISHPQICFSPQFTLLRFSMNTNSWALICIKYHKISFTSTTKSKHLDVFSLNRTCYWKIPVDMNSQTRDSWSQQHGMMDAGRNVRVCRDKLDQVPAVLLLASWKLLQGQMENSHVLSKETLCAKI